MVNIRFNTAKYLKANYGIGEILTEILFEKGILQEHHMRDVLINDEFKKKIQPKEKRVLRNKIAEKYCMSTDSVKKITLKSG